MLYVDNLSVACTQDSLSSFVTNLGVQVISCFKVVPRHRRGQTPDVNRSAFRLCVASLDIDKVLDPTMWPDCVTISEWIYFEPEVKTRHMEKRGRFHSPPNQPAASEGPDQEETESMDATVIYNAVGTVAETSQSSVLSLSAPVFVPFVPPAPVMGEDSQQTDGAGRPGGELVPQGST